MLTFLTLFLGLVYGQHPVELSVHHDVAAAEIRLNGEAVGRLTGEPWVLATDFGEALRPHELVAIAFDADGTEIARDRQWVNLPRSRAEATLTLLDSPGPAGDRAGPSRAARLHWQTLGDVQPLGIRVTLNDKPIQVDDPARIELPAYDPTQVQILTAELDFPDGLRSRAELFFGGTFGDTVSFEMTAVALERTRGRGSLDLDDVSGTLLKDGQPLRVLAAESDGAEIIIVQDPSAQLMLGTLGLTMDRTGRGQRGRTTELKAGERLRVISTHSAISATPEVPYDLFPISEGFEAEDGSLPYLLTHLMIEGGTPVARIADAVAVAGVHAAATNRPRAVVLVLGEERRDASRFKVEQVRNYLADLHVPLVVWGTSQVQSRRVSEDRIPMSHDTPWGKARDISSDSRLVSAAGELRRELDRQAIAWVEGSHLPQDIQLADTAKGVRLLY
jgi:hypothetical protein